MRTLWRLQKLSQTSFFGVNNAQKIVIAGVTEILFLVDWGQTALV